jgi:hypothetical protein
MKIKREMKLASCITLSALAVLSIGFALLMSLLACLGFFGILADVGPAENRKMAGQAGVYAGIAWGLGLVLLTGALLALRAFRKHPKQGMEVRQT